MSYQPESGIAIGPIIFIVAVLAILAAAISAGAGWLTGGTSTESAGTQAAAIVAQGDLIASAVQRVFVENSCADVQISFSNTVLTGNYGSDVYANALSPSNNSCNVFDAQSGGKINYTPPISQALDKTQVGQINYGNFLFNGSFGNKTGSNPQLILYLPYLTQSVCNRINSIVGFPASATPIPWVNSVYTLSSLKFTGSYAYDGTLNDGEPGCAQCVGALKGCLLFNNWDYSTTTLPASTAVYYQVLLPR